MYLFFEHLVNIKNADQLPFCFQDAFEEQAVDTADIGRWGFKTVLSGGYHIADGINKEPDVFERCHSGRTKKRTQEKTRKSC